MRARFLAVISWDEATRTRIAAKMATSAVNLLLLDDPPLLVFASKAGRQLGPRGLLLGTLHSRTFAEFHLGNATRREILRSSGRNLIDETWGGYLFWTVSPDGNQVTVLRAPLGDLPCYWNRSHGLTLLGSDVAVLMGAGMGRPALDPAALTRHIAAEDLRLSETCLVGLRELRGGDALIVDDKSIRDATWWSPWSFTDPHSQIADLDDASAIVRNSVISSVGCQAKQFGSLILKLSGGLDSSIVAACLANHQTPFTCLNLVTSQPAGDERHYAKMVASHLDARHFEFLRRTCDVDLRHSAAARLPRPTRRAFTQASAAGCAKLAADTGAKAVFDGGGGDNVFCSVQSARPAADCLLQPLGRSHYWSTVRSTAELAEVNLWSVVRRSVGISLRRSAAYRLEPDTRFMSREAMEVVRAAPVHPWLNAPQDALPGKAAHVALVAAAQSIVEGPDVEDELPAYSPLIAQPVVEACLKVPSWHWLGKGLNRFAARRAFERDLPLITIERRSKGAPDCFVADLYEANRSTLTELLLGGVLDAHKILDVEAIQAALADDSPVRGHDFLRIMHLADAETWARVWS